jgi:hypothetical protein
MEDALRVREEEGIQRGMQIGEQRGMQIGEQRGMQIGEQRGMQIGEQRGMQIGEQRGMQIGIRETARSLKSLGIAMEHITRATGLSYDEIAKL